MSVPKTAVDVNNLFMLWKNNVGLSRQIFTVKAKAVPQCM